MSTSTKVPGLRSLPMYVQESRVNQESRINEVQDRFVGLCEDDRE